MSETLVISVSGIRGIVGRDLTPELVTRYAAALGTLARHNGSATIVLGRDARTSGPMLADAARAGLRSVGCCVVDCGLVPTPTVQLAVEHHGAGGGIVITASHNPIEWNALKFIGADGLFLDADAGARVRELADANTVERVDWSGIGGVEWDDDAVQRHIDLVLGMPLVACDAIRARRFTVALDCVRGVGGVMIPRLLEMLGCTVRGIHMEADGRFPRPPEPVPEHLGELGALVREVRADVGFAVDPDGDRLALTDETGRAIGEDYTLALAVRTVLERTPGPVVVNQSTSLVVDDTAGDFGVEVMRSKVGEANVARAMREHGAIVGGEGNGGVILPALHLGRDAPIAAALVLDLLARSGKTVNELVEEQPRYVIVKAKAPRRDDMEEIYAALERRFPDARPNRMDGLRLAWDNSWLHVRPSGTEPIVRLIAEARSSEAAHELVSCARLLMER